MATRSPRTLRPMLLGSILLLLFAGGAVAQVALNPSHPARYVVRPGDNLWDIAGRFLRNPWQWREVWQANPGIANPDLIYPGDVLTLHERDGNTWIGVENGRLREVRLTPRVRVEVLDQAIPAIPAGAVAPFLTQAYVLPEPEMDTAPYVVGFPDEHIVAGARDAIYVRSIPTDAVKRYDIVRPGRTYVDPDRDEILGYEATFIGHAHLERPGDPARLQVGRAASEVAVGDRLVPAATAEPQPRLQPRPAPAGVEGRIISVLNGVTQIGQYNVVVLNRGARDGIEAGHVFEVLQGGTVQEDSVRSGLDWRNFREESPLDSRFWYGDQRVMGWRNDYPDRQDPLPPHVEVRKPYGAYVVPYEKSGVLIVFRTFPEVSFALVMNALRPMKVLDHVSAPASE